MSVNLRLTPGWPPAATFPPPVPPTIITSNAVVINAPRPVREFNTMPGDSYTLESGKPLVEGETRTFAVVFHGVTAVTSPSALVYKNETDVTSTVMPSGSASASGNVATLKPITALIGGETYVVAVTATCDGDVRVVKHILPVLSPKTV